MRTGGNKSIVFTPPAADVREAREADQANAKVDADPQEAVLLVGRMLTDVDIIAGEMRTLLFSGTQYRSQLRIVRSASQRLAERAARLLNE